MNTHKMKLAIALFLFSFVSPQISHAYFTTDQTATKLSASAVMFTVSYIFGHETRDFYLPILGTQAETPGSQLGYHFVDVKGQTLTNQSATALVFTDSDQVTVEAGRYKIPAGQTAEFTFVSILNPSPEQGNTALQVTHLPFTMVSDGKNYANQLNPSELQYYRTPVLELE